jgi:hypothetical protein
MQCETVKIKPSSEEQGDYVVINKSDYDDKLHTLYGEKPPKQASTQDESIAVEPKKRGRPAKE